MSSNSIVFGPTHAAHRKLNYIDPGYEYSLELQTTYWRCRTFEGSRTWVRSVHDHLEQNNIKPRNLRRPFNRNSRSTVESVPIFKARCENIEGEQCWPTRTNGLPWNKSGKFKAIQVSEIRRHPIRYQRCLHEFDNSKLYKWSLNFRIYFGYQENIGKTIYPIHWFHDEILNKSYPNCNLKLIRGSQQSQHTRFICDNEYSANTELCWELPVTQELIINGCLSAFRSVVNICRYLSAIRNI